MALINCPDCGKQVSDKTQNCIHCGCPIPQSSEPVKKTRVEIVGIEKLKNKTCGIVKKIGLKKLIGIAAVIAVIIVGAIVVSNSSGGLQMLSAEEIHLNEVYDIKGIGEFEVLRVATTKHFLAEDAGDKTHIVFECNFTNKTSEAYSVSDLATISAKSKETGAIYANCEVGKARNGYVASVVAEPNVESKISFAVEVPADETELIVTITFEENVFNFKYILGELIRNNQIIGAGDTVEVEDVASVNITNIVYSSGVWAPKAYSGRSHRGYSVDNANESTYLIIDTTYANLKHINQAPDDIVKIEAIYEDKYYYTTNKFYTFSNDGKRVEAYLYDNEFIPQSEIRTCMVVEVSKKMIEKEVEINIFIGDKEFTYKGTPRFDDKYGMNLC